MAFKLLSRLSHLTHGWKRPPVAFSTTNSLNNNSLMVRHDRENQRFTVTPDSGAGPDEDAVLFYRFTGPKEVDLMSTFVPESSRGRGVAALLSKAALDFLVEEKVKARVSCWYIQKYLEENPLQRYKDLIVT